MNPLATLEQLEVFWKPITGEDDRSRATALLGYASNYLRQAAQNNGFDIDARISDDASGITQSNVEMVVLSAVHRSMKTPDEAAFSDSWSQSASPYSESFKFVGGAQNLYFKASELRLIGIGSVDGRHGIGVLRGVR